MAEIDLRIGMLDDVPKPADDPADVLPELSMGPCVSKLGDLWCLGRHRVLCADARDHDVAVGLMGGERAAMVFTDPLAEMSVAPDRSARPVERHQ
jgi:hypothetical protein